MASSAGGETRLPFAVDVALLHGAPGELWAVRALHSPIHHAAPVACLLTALACVWTLQGVARRGAEAVAVWLGSLLGQPQAQLDGFKSRVLRPEASTLRHLYLSEWRSLDAASAQSGATLVIGFETWSAAGERLTPNASRRELAATMGGDRAVIVATVAIEREGFAALPLFALEAALALVQAQAAIASALAVWLLTRAMQAPGQAEHAGSWGLARSARAEASLPVHCIDQTAAMVVCAAWCARVRRGTRRAS